MLKGVKKSQREIDRAWREKHPTYSHDHALKKREKAIQMLGGFCAMCGITDIRLLEFDHVVPVCRGTGIRNLSGSYTVRRVLKGNTGNLQVLCANCHKIKTYEEGWHERCR